MCPLRESITATVYWRDDPVMLACLLRFDCAARSVTAELIVVVTCLWPTDHLKLVEYEQCMLCTFQSSVCNKNRNDRPCNPNLRLWSTAPAVYILWTVLAHAVSGPAFLRQYATSQLWVGLHRVLTMYCTDKQSNSFIEGTSLADMMRKLFYDFHPVVERCISGGRQVDKFLQRLS